MAGPPSLFRGSGIRWPGKNKVLWRGRIVLGQQWYFFFGSLCAIVVSYVAFLADFYANLIHWSALAEGLCHTFVTVPFAVSLIFFLLTGLADPGIVPSQELDSQLLRQWKVLEMCWLNKVYDGSARRIDHPQAKPEDGGSKSAPKEVSVAASGSTSSSPVASLILPQRRRTSFAAYIAGLEATLSPAQRQAIQEATTIDLSRQRPADGVYEFMLGTYHFALGRCGTCKGFRPVRSHHCAKCDCCINRLDHHCYWLGTDIGYRNHGFFLIMLFSLIVYVVAITAASVCLLVASIVSLLRAEASPEDWAAVLIGKVLIGGLGGYMCYNIADLANYHVHILQDGITTKEDGRGTGFLVSPYTEGSFWKNFARCFEGVGSPSFVRLYCDQVRYLQKTLMRDGFPLKGYSPPECHDIRLIKRMFKHALGKNARLALSSAESAQFTIEAPTRRRGRGSMLRASEFAIPCPEYLRSIQDYVIDITQAELGDYCGQCARLNKVLLDDSLLAKQMAGRDRPEDDSRKKDRKVKAKDSPGIQVHEDGNESLAIAFDGVPGDAPPEVREDLANDGGTARAASRGASQSPPETHFRFAPEFPGEADAKPSLPLESPGSPDQAGEGSSSPSRRKTCKPLPRFALIPTGRFLTAQELDFFVLWKSQEEIHHEQEPDEPPEDANAPVGLLTMPPPARMAEEPPLHTEVNEPEKPDGREQPERPSEEPPEGCEPTDNKSKSHTDSQLDDDRSASVSSSGSRPEVGTPEFQALYAFNYSESVKQLEGIERATPLPESVDP